MENKTAKILSLIFICFCISISKSLNAHELDIFRVQIVEESNSKYSMTIKLPRNNALLELRPTLPDDFKYSEEPVVITRTNYLNVIYNFNSYDRSLSEEDIIIFPWDLEGAFVNVQWKDGTVKNEFFESSHEGTELKIADLKEIDRPATETAVQYFSSGVEHILIGWDHLAFILGLCLISSGWNLVKLVTAFTIGHSLTLAMAVIGIVNVPILPIEACIALSVCFVARSALISKENSDHQTGLVFCFGLLHGLGFASALSAAGIESTELLLGLFSFNLGVEAGQLIFIGVISILIFLAGKLSLKHTGKYRTAVAYMIGILGFFWLIERVISFRYFN